MSITVGSERILNLLFAAVAGYMIVESLSFGPVAGLFPQLMGGVVFVGSVLLLFREYLPGPLYTFVAKDTELVNTYQNDMSEGAPEVGNEDERTADRPVSPSTFTGLAIGGYLLASFLFGMLWMSPLFVLVYSRWFEQPWLLTVLLMIIAFLTAYAFTIILNLPVNEGILLEFVGL